MTTTSITPGSSKLRTAKTSTSTTGKLLTKRSTRQFTNGRKDENSSISSKPQQEHVSFETWDKNKIRIGQLMCKHGGSGMQIIGVFLMQADALDPQRRRAAYNAFLSDINDYGPDSWKWKATPN